MLNGHDNVFKEIKLQTAFTWWDTGWDSILSDYNIIFYNNRIK